ncbi:MULTISPECIES: sporulation protein YunB [Paenibacillus]|uniref:sporulation protein YunB n=1 Tax=Paenibacillus TaxID=44249 RepID=UPI00048ADC05|nr:sporulation protein YunB [Paenibacillus sp. IHBB 10380]
MRRKRWGSRRLSFPSLSWPKPRRAFKPSRRGFRAVPPRSGGRPQVAKRRSRKKWWLIAIVLIIFGITQFFMHIERNLRPPIMHLAQIRVKQIATEAINKAITSQVTQGQDFENLVNWKTDSSGKVTGFMLNYAEHLKITSHTTQVVQQTLDDIHKRKEHIPLGQVLKSPIIASFGPQIPLKIEPQGAVKVQLDTRQQGAGINMILVEVFVHIVTEVAVVVPFDMEPQTVETDIPISYLLVVGDVPMYYYDAQGKAVGENKASAPSIAIPPPSSNENSAKEGEPQGSTGDTPLITPPSGTTSPGTTSPGSTPAPGETPAGESDSPAQPEGGGTGH